MWDVSTYTPGAPRQVFNESNKFEDTNKFALSEVTAVTGGTVREVDFISGLGVGFNTSGAITEDSGFRLYYPGTYFIAKVTNIHNAVNRILLSYTWIEVPPTFLKVGD